MLERNYQIIKKRIHDLVVENIQLNREVRDLKNEILELKGRKICDCNNEVGDTCKYCYEAYMKEMDKAKKINKKIINMGFFDLSKSFNKKNNLDFYRWFAKQQIMDGLQSNKIEQVNMGNEDPKTLIQYLYDTYHCLDSSKYYQNVDEIISILNKNKDGFGMRESAEEIFDLNIKDRIKSYLYVDRNIIVKLNGKILTYKKGQIFEVYFGNGTRPTTSFNYNTTCFEVFIPNQNYNTFNNIFSLNVEFCSEICASVSKEKAYEYLLKKQNKKENMENIEVKTKIDIKKKYKTVSGDEVILHTTNGINKNAPVIGEIIRKKLDNAVQLNCWNEYGHNHKYAVDDLVELRINHKETYYYNIYRNGEEIGFVGFKTPEHALEHRGEKCIATKSFDFEFYEGEGL